MENRRDEENNMESDDCSNSIVSTSSELTAVAVSDSDHISKVYRRATSHIYFHENLTKNVMINIPMPNRIQMFRHVKADLLEELNRINAMQNRVKDLVQRYDDYKKS